MLRNDRPGWQRLPPPNNKPSPDLLLAFLSFPEDLLSETKVNSAFPSRLVKAFTYLDTREHQDTNLT
jgi:hypothetical protein